ncbi:MAG TPA: polymer-forming cytoskeletal protein [Blastocatellia bacterium]|nr:polymer-forming cytoskeletal protein [Blastocatellia bacterium]
MKGFKSESDDTGQGRISRGVQISGDVQFADALFVDGKVIGKVYSETGSLLIEQAGDVQADIDVGICVVRGTVRGNINCKSRAEIYKTGRVEGDINSPVLLVEEGAILSGTIDMSNGGSRGRSKETAQLTEQGAADAAEQLRRSKGAS